jgi:hypothetical protein
MSWCAIEAGVDVTLGGLALCVSFIHDLRQLRAVCEACVRLLCLLFPSPSVQAGSTCTVATVFGDALIVANIGRCPWVPLILCDSCNSACDAAASSCSLLLLATSSAPTSHTHTCI